MTKPLTIDTAAAWAGTITTIQDGDPASEATMDVVMDSVGDRLGYLKATSDNSLLLASNAAQTLSGTGNISITGSRTVSVACPTAITSNLTLSATTYMNGAGVILSSGARISIADALNNGLYCAGTVELAYEVLPNADAPMDHKYESRVPVVTGARTYSLPFVSSTGQRKRISRVDNTSNHSITIQAGGITMGVIAANSQGWIECVGIQGGTLFWRVSAWGGSVSSIYATVS